MVGEDIIIKFAAKSCAIDHNDYVLQTRCMNFWGSGWNLMWLSSGGDRYLHHCDSHCYFEKRDKRQGDHTLATKIISAWRILRQLNGVFFNFFFKKKMFLSNCWICAQLKLGRQFSTFWSRWNFGPGVVEAGKLWVSALVWVLEVIIVPYITISVSHPLKAHCLQSDRGIKWIIRGSDSTFCSVTFTPPLFFGFVLRGQQLSRPS